LYGIAKHLRATLAGTVRGFVNPAALDALENFEHFHCAELGDRTGTDVREHQCFKGPSGLRERGRRQFLLLQCQPFARDSFERIRGRQILGLPLAAGIYAGSELPARSVATLACLFQRCVGMGAQGAARVAVSVNMGAWTFRGVTMPPVMPPRRSGRQDANLHIIGR
jgi:hypothetical protein